MLFLIFLWYISDKHFFSGHSRNVLRDFLTDRIVSVKIDAIGVFEKFILERMVTMTEDDKQFLDRITAYAEEVMADMDAEKTRISIQLDKLRPVMEEIAAEQNAAVEDVFIRYMDLASAVGAQKQEKFKKDYLDFDDLNI